MSGQTALLRTVVLAAAFGLQTTALHALDVELVADVDGQPLGANVMRVVETLAFLGAPLPETLAADLKQAGQNRDAVALQKLLDSQAVFVLSLNPEVRVKVQRGPGRATLQQAAFTPLIVKILNDSEVASRLRIRSPQAGPVYSGPAISILKRQDQTELKDDENLEQRTDRFLSVEMFDRAPLTPSLSGLKVEYAVALISSSEAGQREATVEFDVGAGTQDIGFRGEVPVLFNVLPAIRVPLQIRDVDGQSTTARLTIRDRAGRIYPPQAKRLAPDFFFQPHIYRADGESVLLPPGEFAVEYCRGPEYRVLHRTFEVAAVDEQPSQDTRSPLTAKQAVALKLARWVDARQFGFYSGDHHIHGAGCSHYDSPTEGVTPQDMFRQVKGEGLNVGCVLTWGPCYDFQRNYFSPGADEVSEPLTLLKYDVEVSGFGSAALGHVCLLNLRNQTYPASEGTKEKGWPTWTVPVLKWCREQGGVTGYPHSAMHVQPPAEASRLLEAHDSDRDGGLSREEASSALLAERFAIVDEDGNGQLSAAELTRSADRAADRLPNLAVPALTGGGAMEIFVSVPEGVCDFISAMDTARIPEWNTWYHLMNCGFPLKLSGETDFPCMSSRRVGQGRVYVQLGDVDPLDFTAWCNGIAAGRSYVSDGFAHALRFTVDGQSPGFDDVTLDKPQSVQVKATVAFAPETPIGVAYGNLLPTVGRRMLGDTVNLHAPRSMEYLSGGQRKVEIVVNGQTVATVDVPADGKPHDVAFPVEITQSSWVALRQFPQLHTNPVNVLVAGRPIRASKSSARWCAESVRLLWKNRNRFIADEEKSAARAAYDRALSAYERIATEASEP
ncbi:hypothetical protein GC176_21745 [bacterium]|nr:hypothetical protein [bacterium]